MPLCANCLLRGQWVDMCKVDFALPELYPDSHFPRHSNNHELEKTLNWTSYTCPKCSYQSPLEGWDMWQKRQKPTKAQWNILREKTPGPQLVF